MNSAHETAVLLVNLGTPDSYEVKDVRRYLGEFLMDKYVLDVPYVLRALLVNLLIKPIRASKSAEAYKSIWWEEGSPLMVLSKQLLADCQKDSFLPIELGMRYGNPSIKAGIDNLLNQHPKLKKVILFPLYPHFAMSSYETVVEKCKSVIDQHFPQLIMQSIAPFYKHPSYIDCLIESIQAKKDKFDYLLFSYHGIPVRHLKVSDNTKKHCQKVPDCCHQASTAHQTCYKHQCLETTYAVVNKMKLEEESWGISFQSRLGPEPWLSPYTDKTIEALAKKGVKRLGIICPAFVSDCLETLEEMGEEGKEIFEEHGGEHLELIPCLNTQPSWVKTIHQLIDESENT